jgi:hypothetical protein
VAFPPRESHGAASGAAAFTMLLKCHYLNVLQSIAVPFELQAQICDFYFCHGKNLNELGGCMDDTMNVEQSFEPCTFRILGA